MKRINIRILLLTILICFSFMTCIPVAAAEETVTIKDYEAITQKILEKYHMQDIYDAKLESIPPRDLKEHAEIMEFVISSNARAYREKMLPKTPEFLSHEQQNPMPRMTYIYHRYNQFKNFNYDFEVWASYEISIPSSNYSAAHIVDSNEKMKKQIIGRETGNINLRKHKFVQNYAEVIQWYPDGSFRAHASGTWYTLATDATWYKENINLDLLVDFGREELAYARSKGAFK